MRDVKLFLAGLGFILFGCALWQVQPELRMLGLAILGLAYLSIAIGAIAEIVCLGRLAAPLAEKILDLRHKSVQIRHQENEMLLRLQVVEYAQTNRLQLEMADMKVTYPARPMVQVHEEAQKQLPPPQEQELLLPGRCDFAEILEVWRPSPQQILLGLAPGGGYVTVPLKALCHVALAGATGGGKSVLMRLLLSQLIFVGARVILADPHFAAVDAESGEDWRPIASRLYMEPSVSYPAIKDTLKWMAEDELPKRLERRRNGELAGTPYFLALDELPAIVAKVPDAPEYMAELLREGRKVGLYLVSAAQDWLVKTVGGSGAVRDCFRTAIYVGGDATSARVLLDVKGTVDDGGLGKGIVMMRSSATPKAALSRVPYASNDALYDLLAVPSTAIHTAHPTSPLTAESLQNIATLPTAQWDTDPDQTTHPIVDARMMRIREMVRSKILPSKIIEEIWGISAKQGGAAYAKAARELSDIMSSLV